MAILEQKNNTYPIMINKKSKLGFTNNNFQEYIYFYGILSQNSLKGC